MVAAGLKGTPSARASAITSEPSSNPYFLRSPTGMTTAPRLPIFVFSVSMTHHLLMDEYQIFRFLSRSDFVVAWDQPLDFRQFAGKFYNSFYIRKIGNKVP
jgi:hypothetical protein